MPPSDLTEPAPLPGMASAELEQAISPLAPPAQLLYAGFWLLGADNNIETVSYPVHLRIDRVETEAADQPVDWGSFTDAAGNTIQVQRTFKLASAFFYDPPMAAPPVVVVSVIDGHTNSSAILTDCANTSFTVRIVGDATQVSVAVFGQPPAT